MEEITSKSDQMTVNARLGLGWALIVGLFGYDFVCVKEPLKVFGRMQCL